MGEMHGVIDETFEDEEALFVFCEGGAEESDSEVWGGFGRHVGGVVEVLGVVLVESTFVASYEDVFCL
jgi:hypothetical protein